MFAVAGLDNIRRITNGELRITNYELRNRPRPEKRYNNVWVISEENRHEDGCDKVPADWREPPLCAFVPLCLLCSFLIAAGRTRLASADS